MTTPGPRKCRYCKTVFTPDLARGIACSIKCAVELTRIQHRKEFAAETRRLKESIKTTAQLEAELQRQVNRFILLRDKFLPCISCGRTGGRMNAGHYVPWGGANGVGALRFSELNLAGQCVHCNKHHSGATIGYRQGLIARHGIEIVTWLESVRGPHGLSDDDLRALKRVYITRAKERQEWNQQHAWIFQATQHRDNLHQPVHDEPEQRTPP